jgi:hypothetical protein
MLSSMKLSILLAAVGALVLSASAPAATSIPYTGMTKQQLPVTLTASATKVTHFRADVRCTGGKVRAFKLPAMPVDRHGHFSLNQAGPSVSGTVNKNRAKGLLTLPGCDAGATELRFTAFPAD